MARLTHVADRLFITNALRFAKDMKKWPLLSSSVLAHARRCLFMAHYARDCVVRLDTTLQAVVGQRLVPRPLPAYGFYLVGDEVSIMTSDTSVYRLSGAVETIPAGVVPLIFEPPSSPPGGDGGEDAGAVAAGAAAAAAIIVATLSLSQRIKQVTAELIGGEGSVFAAAVTTHVNASPDVEAVGSGAVGGGEGGSEVVMGEGDGEGDGDGGGGGDGDGDGRGGGGCSAEEEGYGEGFVSDDEEYS